MKLQIFILTLGIVASAGAVNAELNRSTGGATTTPTASALVAASQTSPKQPTTRRSIYVSHPVSTQPVTTLSTGHHSGAKPSIAGISASGENDD